MNIQNNIASMNSARNQQITDGKLKKSLERLSSGFRINRAGDDAAGLTISELMRNQINGLDQAMRNVNDGIGMSRTGEGALAEIHSMLQRMKTLSVQAANGTYDSTARLSIESERIQLLDEIDRISQSSDFNDIPLFGGQVPAGIPIVPPQLQDEITLQIGHTAEETLGMERYYMGSQPLRLDNTDFTSSKGANESVDIIEDAIQAVAQVRASFGAAQNHLEHTDNNLGVTKENMTAAESRIRDTDMADELTEYTRNNIMLQSGSAMLVHANDLPQTILDLIK